MINHAILIFSLVFSSCSSQSDSTLKISAPEQLGQPGEMFTFYSKFYLGQNTLLEGTKNSVYDLDVDVSDNLYIGDYRKNQLLILDSNYKSIKQIPGVTTPHGIGVDSLKNIYASTFKNGRVVKFNSSYEEIPNWDKNLIDSNLIQWPISIDINLENNHILIADYKLQNIIIVDEAGNLVQDFKVVIDANIKNFTPHSIHLSSGIIYCTDLANKAVHRFNISGSYEGIFINLGASSFPAMIKSTINGNLLLIDSLNQAPFHLYQPDGIKIKELGGHGSLDGQFLGPTSFAHNSNGDLFIVEEKGNRVQKVSIKP
jgi:hypothetical protein